VFVCFFGAFADNNGALFVCLLAHGNYSIFCKLKAAAVVSSGANAHPRKRPKVFGVGQMPRGTTRTPSEGQRRVL
jgi:hypothetical protein